VAQAPLEIEATVRDKNQMTIPRQVAERHRIEPGARVIFLDQGRHGEFTVRVLPSTYAGALTGVYGNSTDDAVEYVRNEREDWA